MKYEWRKKEKGIYLPKNKPELITLPPFKFFMIEGKGDPNDDSFGEYIGVLYSLSYAVKMSHRKGIAPKGYFEYTVYPLEGVWDISDEGKKNYKDFLDKSTFIFNLMVRQPDFVTDEFAQEIIEITGKKKPHELLGKVKFGIIEEGKCVQMMHIGSYDSESESFKKMEEFCKENSLIRKSKKHKEIYMSDPRKVSPEKLKTVLRFKVKDIN